MGAVLAKFRKPKTTTEILETLEKDIKVIEEYALSTQAKQKRIVGNFLLISIGLYMVGFLIFYFAFFPPLWMERITYSIPLLIFPLLIFFIKRLVAWYFQRKLNKNSVKLNKLQGEKKKIIERVMEKETYKNAVEILSRFADKNSGYKSIEVMSPRTKVNQQMLTPGSLSSTQQSQQQLMLTPNNAVNRNNSNNLVRRTPSTITPLLSQQRLGQINNSSPIVRNEGVTALRSVNLQQQQQQQSSRKTPFPIINLHQQSVLEKIVDYLIGDGPYNRYAMICKECHNHNGMATQEEYEYSSFRCVFCNAMNPSKKLRPVSPKLQINTDIALPVPQLQSSSSPSSSSSSSIEEVAESAEVAPINFKRSNSTTDSEPDSETNKIPTKSENITNTSNTVCPENVATTINNSDIIENKDNETSNVEEINNVTDNEIPLDNVLQDKKND